MIALLRLLLSLLAMGLALADSEDFHPISVDDFVKIRCRKDSHSKFSSFSGNVFAKEPSKPATKIFQFFGVNVARCVKSNGTWYVTSRELGYFLDPTTGRKIDRWRNPATGKEVPVMHLQNSLVITPLGPSISSVQGFEKYGQLEINFDVPLFYKNPLYPDLETRKYSPSANFDGAEFFKFFLRKEEMELSTNTVRKVAFAWNRESPWMPWMDMGTRPGRILFSAHGFFLHNITSLPKWVQEDIATHLPLYSQAPRAIHGASVTSWTFFKENFKSYLAGARFPLPAPLNEEIEIPPPVVAEVASTPEVAKTPTEKSGVYVPFWMLPVLLVVFLAPIVIHRLGLVHKLRVLLSPSYSHSLN